jgi:hypothetical protein
MYTSSASAHHSLSKSNEKHKQIITSVMDTTSHTISSLTSKSVSGAILSVGTSIISETNQKHRQRSEDEKMIRACAGLTASAMAFSSNPYVGGAIATGLVVSEYGEMHMRMEKERNKQIYTDLKKAGMADDMIRDIIFERSVGCL